MALFSSTHRESKKFRLDHPAELNDDNQKSTPGRSCELKNGDLYTHRTHVIMLWIFDVRADLPTIGDTKRVNATYNHYLWNIKKRRL
jgi:hypothetical protein